MLKPNKEKSKACPHKILQIHYNLSPSFEDFSLPLGFFLLWKLYYKLISVIQPRTLYTS